MNSEDNQKRLRGFGHIMPQGMARLGLAMEIRWGRGGEEEPPLPWGSTYLIPWG